MLDYPTYLCKTIMPRPDIFGVIYKHWTEGLNWWTTPSTVLISEIKFHLFDTYALQLSPLD